MKDEFGSLFAFNRWANARILDACRKLTPEQYAAEPVPGWSSVRATVCHIAVVTELWLRGLANDPDDSLPTEVELPTCPRRRITCGEPRGRRKSRQQLLVSAA
jgi:uncharacterized damage-inducible protein DinB